MAERWSYPDGLAAHHAVPRRFGRHASPVSILVLGVLLALALAGVLAGGRSPERTVTAPAATLRLAAPALLRNGEYFEMRIEVVATAPIKDMTFAVTPELWRDMTINSQVPAASEEAFENDAFAFHYGAMATGERFVVKIDGQINPPLTRGTAGRIEVRDGKRTLAKMPVTIRVLP